MLSTYNKLISLGQELWLLHFLTKISGELFQNFSYLIYKILRRIIRKNILENFLKVFHNYL